MKHLFKEKTFRLVDTHAHLEEYQDVERVVANAKEGGIVAIIAVGVDYDANVRTLELSKSYEDFIFPAIGIHPWEVEGDVEKGVNFIEKNIEECVAIGEIGLDYWIKTDKKNQKKVFERLLNIAVKTDKPISVHSRGAWEEAYTLVANYNIKKAVFHWYSGPIEVLRMILDNNYFVSASPAAEYSKKLREALQQTPLVNLLLETDSPVKYKGVESEPRHVRKTLHYVAKLKKIEEEKLAEITTENALKFFGLR